MQHPDENMACSKFFRGAICKGGLSENNVAYTPILYIA